MHLWIIAIGVIPLGINSYLARLHPYESMEGIVWSAAALAAVMGIVWSTIWFYIALTKGTTRQKAILSSAGFIAAAGSIPLALAVTTY